jgi:hypothetical protein
VAAIFGYSMQDKKLWIMVALNDSHKNYISFAVYVFYDTVQV